MKVEGVRVQVLPPVQPQTESHTKPTVDETPRDQPQSSEKTETTGGEIDGVIRNLLDGHFKGVADVRLRINHFEQLALIAAESLKAAAEAEVTSVLDVVGSEIDNLPGPTELLTAEGASGNETETETETETVTGLHQEFDDTVIQLNGDFQSAETPSADDLITGIEDAFSVFIEALQDLLVPPAEDNSGVGEEAGTQISGEPTETDPPPAGVEAQITSESEPAGAETPTDDGSQATESTEPDYQILLDDINSAFADAIAELTEALNEIQAPPELSEPSGNGGAYEKFLAIYNELWGFGADQDNTASSEDVDMTA